MDHDFIEAVTTRPKMYTLRGTYPEVVAFLEGYFSGLAKSSIEAQDVIIWSQFRQWIATKLGNPKSSELALLHQKLGDTSIETFRAFYLEYKTEKSLTNNA